MEPGECPTCVSYGARRGATHEDRRLLQYGLLGSRTAPADAGSASVRGIRRRWRYEAVGLTLLHGLGRPPALRRPLVDASRGRTLAEALAIRQPARRYPPRRTSSSALG